MALALVRVPEYCDDSQSVVGIEIRGIFTPRPRLHSVIPGPRLHRKNLARLAFSDPTGVDSFSARTVSSIGGAALLHPKSSSSDVSQCGCSTPGV